MSGLIASGTLTADPAFRPPGPRRRPARVRRRPWREDMRRGVGVSVLLHLLVLAAFLIVMIEPSERDSSVPEPSFEIVYQSGNPERPAAPVPDLPKAPQAAVLPPPAPAAEPLPTPPPPPPPPPEPRPQQVPASVPPPPPPLAEAPAAWPMPPPPPPAPPRRETQTAQPPSPPSQATPQAQARPTPPPPLPGVWMPGASTLATPPRQQAAPQPRLDTTLDTVAMVGRYALEPMLQVKGAEVGADWTAAFRRWSEENIFFPRIAAEAGHSGVNKVRVLIAADGTVLSVTLTKPSGSPNLDFGLTTPFKGAKLPAPPPPVDPNGFVLELTMRWIQIGR